MAETSEDSALFARLAGTGEATGACRLDGHDEAAYLVLDGPADVFAVRRRSGGGSSRRHLVARYPAGSLVPSSAALGVWHLLLVPLPGTRLKPITADRMALLERRIRADHPSDRFLAAARAMTAALDAGLVASADAMRHEQSPREALALSPGQIISLAAGAVLTCQQGVWWVRPLGGRLRRNNDGPTQLVGDRQLIPLARRDWVTADSACTVESNSSWQLLLAGQLRKAVDDHMGWLLRLVEARISIADADFLHAIRQRKRANASVVASAARQALGVVGVPGVELPARDFSLLDPYHRPAAVLRCLLGAQADTVLSPTDRSRPPADEHVALAGVARSSGIHLREVSLPPNWWRRDLGPLIGWRAAPELDRDAGTDDEDAAPAERAVPLVYRRGRYHEIDPETRAHLPVSAAVADSIAENAVQVQLPLPPVASLKDLARSALRGAGADLTTMLLCGVVVAVLGLGTPLVTGAVLGGMATQGTQARLLQFAAMLVCASVVAALVGVAQNLRFLRLEGRAELGTQLAVWDRLMRLPTRYFADTTSGEVANTVLGVSFAREAMSGLLAQAFVSALTVLADLVLLFVFDPLIGLVGLLVLLAVAVIAAVVGILVIRRQRRALPYEYRAAALTNQLLGGITKIKLAGAQDRAFGRWSGANSAARDELQQVRRVQAVIVALAGAVPMCGQLALFAILAGPLAGRIGPDRFFTVNAAFSLLLGGAVVLLAAAVEVLAILPRLENLRDVIGVKPERRPDRIDPGDLRGEIDLTAVSFGYHRDQPPILREVSLSIASGEFVAIVGPTGCGKSTLLRMLLGFEAPWNGAVRFDGQDLSELDMQAVRRQCGVVLQDGRLFAGTIRENICGAGAFSLDRVWEAARMAGLDEDLNQLPMGLGTMLPFGGGTLSVGQRQRVLIARALVRRPRVLLFDEATSALDNQTQAVVAASTRVLAATRVVIAHRLSTVVDADTIVVLDKGSIVQQGSYAELMTDTDGMFHRLARRQLLEPGGG